MEKIVVKVVLKKHPELMQVNTHRLLTDLGAIEIKRVDDEWKFSCINPDHPDIHPSMSFNEKNGYYNCFSCGAKGRWWISLVMQATKCSYNEAVDTVVEYVVLVRDHVEKPEPKRLIREKHVCPDLVDIPYKAIKYLDHRGIPLWFAVQKKARWNEDMQRIVIPVESAGWTARKIEDNIEVKWLHSRGFSKSNTLYNYHLYRKKKMVGVVEGVFDCWKVELCGFSCVATLGAQITNNQLNLLNQFPELVVIPDNDQGGDLFVEKISMLSSVNLYVVKLPKKDAGDCGLGELRECWENKVSFWSHYSHLFKRS